MSLIKDYNRIDVEEKRLFYKGLTDIGITQLNREVLSYVSIAS